MPEIFELETAIARWRRRLLEAGLTDSAALDELESHLRADIQALCARGEPAFRAFALAAARFGEPVLVRREFCKLEGSARRPYVISFGIWGFFALASSIYFAAKVFARTMDPVLAFHITALVLGYLAGFIAGGLALWSAAAHRSSVSGAPWRRAAAVFVGLSAVFVPAALLVGFFWAKAHLGSFWSRPPAEIRTFSAAGLLIAALIVQRRRRLASRSQEFIAFAASLTCALAWFVPDPVAARPACCSALVFLALNALCFGLGVAAKSKSAA